MKEITKDDNGRQYSKEYILNYKEITYLLDIVKSDLSDMEKARLLCLTCSFERFKDNFDLIETRKPRIKKELNKLYPYYLNYNKEGLFPTPFYNCASTEIEKYLELLNIIYNGLNSNISDLSKVELFLQYFPNREAFKKQYLPFVKLGKKDARLNIARDALNNFSNIIAKLSELNIKGLFDEVRYYQKYQNYFSNYEYAQFVIDYYLQSPSSFNKKLIYEELGINEDIFTFCVETIRELNVELYKKYLAKLENSQIEENIFNQNRINDIVEAIKTGFFQDGTPLDLLEFLKRLPFTETRSFFSDLRTLVGVKKEQIIVDFIRENKLNLQIPAYLKQCPHNINIKIKPFPPLDLNEIYNRKNIVNGYELTTDDIDCIIAYLEVRGIPFLIKAYEIAKKDYIDGKFNWDIVRKLQSDVPLKKTLIPTLKK